MSDSKEIDDELEANDNVFSRPNRCLMPELPLEQDVSAIEIQQAMEQFPRIFTESYPSSGPALYLGPLDEAMDQSIFSSNEPRPLSIYLHRTETAATHCFCKNVLCNEFIINYLAENYIVWAWDCSKDANYQRLLWMLLQYIGSSAAAMVAAIPLDKFPVLVCLLSTQQLIILDSTTSPDEIYTGLIEIRDDFHNPSEEMIHDGSQRLSICSNENWYPGSSQLELVEQESDKFRNTANYFNNNSYQIIRVEQINNKNWLTKYEEQKEVICNRIGHNGSERILFHGCLRETSQDILRQGFHHEQTSIHGTKYGHGFHFSTDPKRSHIYALPDLPSGGERTMLVCRVLIGGTRRNHSIMEIHPSMFDSTTDGSEIYVVFSNLQILPEYLVTYK